MKKSLLIYILTAIFLIGCSNTNENINDKKETTENPPITENKETSEKPGNKNTSNSLSKEELFNKLADEASLESYKSDGITEEIHNAESENPVVVSKSEGYVEFKEEPNVYHALYDSYHESVGNMEMEYYNNDTIMVYRKDNSGWVEASLEKDGAGAYNLSDTNKNRNSVLKELEKYYTITETDDAYIASLESTPENVYEIRDAMMGNVEDQIFIGELQSIKTNHKFDKQTLYPISHDWEMRFNTDSDGVVLFKETANYKEVNEVKEIVIPEEVKAMLCK